MAGDYSRNQATSGNLRISWKVVWWVKMSSFGCKIETKYIKKIRYSNFKIQKSQTVSSAFRSLP